VYKNVSGQGVYLYAYDTTNGVAKTGDAANITGSYSLGGGAAAAVATLHPTEIGGGIYWQPLSQAETNGDTAAYYWASGTSGVQIDPVTVAPLPGTSSGVSSVVAAGGISDASFTVPSLVSPATGPVGYIFQLWRRFFKKVHKDATTLKTYADDSTTIITTQTYTSAGGVDDVGAAS
jgi:hypothetical protein